MFFILMTIMSDSGKIGKEKSDASHSSGSRGYPVTLIYKYRNFLHFEDYRTRETYLPL